MTLVQSIASNLLLISCLNQFRELDSRNKLTGKPTKQILLYVADSITGWSIVDFFGTRLKMVTRSITTVVHDCSMTSLSIVTPSLHGYKTYATSNDSRFNKRHLDESPHTMQMTLYFAICHFLCPDLVFKALPRRPPDGFITDGLALVTISLIFGLLVSRAWIRMLQFSAWRFIQRLISRELCIYCTKHRRFEWFSQAEPSLTRLAAYTTSDSLGDEPMLYFDTDSSFWVCDNAATGHICREMALFSEDLVPSIYKVSTANGIDSPTLMGTVILRLRDNAGIMHESCLILL